MALVYFVVGNIAEHSGFVTSREDSDVWTNENPSGWTYQEVTGAHGRILDERPTQEEADQVLSDWLRCDDDRCYSHGVRS